MRIFLKNSITFLKNYFKNTDIQKIIMIFLVTRIIFIFFGLYIRTINVPSRMYDVPGELETFGKIGTIFHGWDSVWYLRIAESGYPKVSIAELPETETALAFYPLYPLLIKTLGTFFGFIPAGIVISNLAFLLAGIFLYELVKIRRGASLAYNSSKFLFIFPTSFILSAMQTEPLFLCLFLLAFLLLEKGNLLGAGIVGFFLSLTRPIGFVMVIPILLSSFGKGSKNLSKGLIKGIASSALPILGIFLFAAYLATRTGSLNAIFVSENVWGKAFNFNPFDLYHLIGSNWKGVYQTDVIFGCFTLFFVFFGLKELDFRYTVTVASIVFIYLVTTIIPWHLLSFPRFFSVLFPAYIGAASLAQTSKLFDRSATFTFLVMQIGLFFYWSRGFPTPM